MRVTNLSAIAIAMGATIGSGCAWAQGAAPAASVPPPVITATGRGEAHVAADHATVTIAVETHAPTASAAAASNATAMTATLASLHRIGLTDADLSTTGFSVSTDYMRPTPTNVPAPVSFVARNGVRVALRTPTKLGTVIDSALAAGATQVGQAQFTSSRIEEVRRAALTQAVEQAHSDAEAIAHAAGGSLGELIEISAPGGGAMFYEAQSLASVQIRGVAGGVAAPPPPTPLAPSDVSIAVTVMARWRFIPGH